MTLIRCALFRTSMRLATLVAGAALLAACSNASTSPGSPATVPSVAAAAETPVTSSVPPVYVRSSAPSMAALPPMLGAGTGVACDPADSARSCLAPGTYRLTGGPDAWPVMVTIDLPAGWFEPGAGELGAADSGWDAVLVQGGPDTQYSGTGWGVMFTTVGDVDRDPCDASKGTIPAAQVNTPQKVAAAIAAWPKFSATAPKPITVDGHPGVKLTLSRTSASTACGSGSSWTTTSGATVDAYPMVYGRSYPGTNWIVDTGHGLLAIRAMDFPDTSPFELVGGVAQSSTRHVADQPKLHAILDSIRITDWPTAG